MFTTLYGWVSTNQTTWKTNSQSEQWKYREDEQTSKLTKARENAGYKVAIGYHWNLIGLKSGASFLDQS